MSEAPPAADEATPGNGEPIRVFLLDDHEVVRRGVRDLLEADGDLVVVGEAGSAEEALRRIPSVHPQVAVLDVQLGDGSGIEVCRDIRSSHPEIHCLMLTSYADDEAMLDSVVAGASGYVLKQIRGNELVESVRKVAAGRSLLDPAMTARVIERLRRGPEQDDRLASLTPQERRILTLLADGLTVDRISRRLTLSVHTTRGYVKNLLAKLEAHSQLEAVAVAKRRGLLRSAS